MYWKHQWLRHPWKHFRCVVVYLRVFSFSCVLFYLRAFSFSCVLCFICVLFSFICVLWPLRATVLVCRLGIVQTFSIQCQFRYLSFNVGSLTVLYYGKGSK